VAADVGNQQTTNQNTIPRAALLFMVTLLKIRKSYSAF